MSVPDEDTFRAVARSSPWLWSSMRLRREATYGASRTAVQAWIRRPGWTRVESVDGALLETMRPRKNTGRPRKNTGRAAFRLLGTDQGGSAEQPRVVTAHDRDAPQPERRPDGLIATRPDSLWMALDDPMYVNYVWVAMLDPVELADGHEPADEGPGPVVPAVELLSLAESPRAGRRSLVATVRPTRAYDPRCGCCPLLFGEVSQLAELGYVPQQHYADQYQVVLDIETGICVEQRDIGGETDGAGFHVTIEEVDQPYPDELFTASR